MVISRKHRSLSNEQTGAALEAEQMAAMWLYRGNVARDKGELELAERHYARAQKWHDKMNEGLGNL